jgi:hypothetical protein
MTYLSILFYFFSEQRNKFWWFGHMWRHEQAHKFEQEKLEISMIKNYQFAKVRVIK